MVYALDTNIIIHYLRDELNVHKNFNAAVMRKCDLVVPNVVDYEICRGFCARPAARKEAAYQVLVEKCEIVEMDAASWARAKLTWVELYNKRFTVGELDILIAAICLGRGYTLVTNNTDDFKNIDGLALEDWTIG